MNSKVAREMLAEGIENSVMGHHRGIRGREGIAHIGGKMRTDAIGIGPVAMRLIRCFSDFPLTGV